MTRTQTLVALFSAFVLGCVAASRVIVPAYAQQPNAKKWEQFCSYRTIFDRATITDELNADLKAKGTEGWELVGASITGGALNLTEYCFKRPAP